MRQYICDICKKDVGDSLKLSTLKQEYQTKDIKELCKTCLQIVEDIKRKHLSVAHKEARDEIVDWYRIRTK